MNARALDTNKPLPRLPLLGPRPGPQPYNPPFTLPRKSMIRRIFSKVRGVISFSLVFILTPSFAASPSFAQVGRAGTLNQVSSVLDNVDRTWIITTVASVGRSSHFNNWILSPDLNVLQTFWHWAKTPRTTPMPRAIPYVFCFADARLRVLTRTSDSTPHQVSLRCDRGLILQSVWVCHAVCVCLHMV